MCVSERDGEKLGWVDAGREREWGVEEKKGKGLCVWRGVLVWSIDRGTLSKSAPAMIVGLCRQSEPSPSAVQGCGTERNGAPSVYHVTVLVDNVYGGKAFLLRLRHWNELALSHLFSLWVGFTFRLLSRTMPTYIDSIRRLVVGTCIEGCSTNGK